MGTLEAVAESLISGQASKVKELIQKALDEGIAVQQILNEGLIAPMTIIGERFKKEEIYLPEVLFSARSMLEGMAMLEPILVGSGAKPVGKVALGTVKGDVHTIGKNLVGIMLKGAGFQVTDLGTDVPAEKFVKAAEEGAQIIAMSALTSTTMLSMQPVIESLEAAGLKGQAKTMVGGAIVTQAFADRIGADGYAKDAVAAVAKAKSLLGLS